MTTKDSHFPADAWGAGGGAGQWTEPGSVRTVWKGLYLIFTDIKERVSSSKKHAVTKDRTVLSVNIGTHIHVQGEG